jgi:hypothetical protein
MTDISLSPMSAPAKAGKAEREKRLAESQATAADPAISPASPSDGERQPAKPVKRTVAAIDRNLEASDQVHARLAGKLKAARASQDPEIRAGIPSLLKALDNLKARKEMLLRLKAKEEKYVD